MSTAAAMGIAGCTADDPEDTDGDTLEDTDPDESESSEEAQADAIEHPPGFTEEGFENFETALGSESPLLSVDSLTLTTEQEREQVEDHGYDTGGEQRNVSQVDATENILYITDTLADNTEEAYQTDEGTYVLAPNGDVTFNEELTYEAERAVGVDFNRHYFEGLTFQSVTENAAGNIVYTADLAGENLQGTAITEVYDNIQSGQLEFEIAPDGLPQEITIEIRYEEEPRDNTIEMDQWYTVTYEAYDETEIEEPQWVTDHQ